MKQQKEKGALALTFIAGLSVNGTFSALFSEFVPFSVFPLLTLVLSVYGLSQRYRDVHMTEGVPRMAFAWFVLGILLYSAFVRVEYPAMGSNLLPSLLSVILFLWIMVKTRSGKRLPRE